MHLAFVAGLAGWIAGALWRRARWRGIEAPLIVPAQQVAVAGAMVAAAAYAALAGFNVPVQRALWMLTVDNVKQDGRFTDNHLGRSTGLIVGGYSAMFVAPSL